MLAIFLDSFFFENCRELLFFLKICPWLRTLNGKPQKKSNSIWKPTQATLFFFIWKFDNPPINFSLRISLNHPIQIVDMVFKSFSSSTRRGVAEAYQVSHIRLFFTVPRSEKLFSQFVHFNLLIISQDQFSVEPSRLLHDRENLSWFEPFYVPFGHLWYDKSGVPGFKLQLTNFI